MLKAERMLVFSKLVWDCLETSKELGRKNNYDNNKNILGAQTETT